MANLKVKKGDTTYTIKLYDTEAGAGTPGTIYGTLKLRINDVNYYARITQSLASGTVGGPTPLRYKNAAGNIYQVTQKGEFSITVPSSSGQTICVSANGQTYKGANTLWFAEDTVWKAWVEVDSSHIAGSLNLTGGTLNSTVNLSVTSAATIPSGSKDYSFHDSSSYETTFTVPQYIHVLHVEGTSEPYLIRDYKNSYNIRVTPGKTYTIKGKLNRYKSGSTYNLLYSLSFNDLDIVGVTEHTATMKISWSGTINTHSTDHDFS